MVIFFFIFIFIFYRHSHFISSSSLLSGDSDPSSISSPTGSGDGTLKISTKTHLSAILSLLTDQHTHRNLSQDTRLLSLRWSHALVLSLAHAAETDASGAHKANNAAAMFAHTSFLEMLDALLTLGKS